MGVHVRIRTVLFMVAVLGSACSGSGVQYPEAVIGNFMASCEAQGATTAACAYTIDHIQSELSLEEFAREDARLPLEGPSDRFTTVMARAIEKCG